MHATSLRLASFALVILTAFLVPRRAEAANVLLVCEETAESGLAAVLTGDGHTVTTVTNDGSAPTSVLDGDLSAYDLVVWSGTTSFRDAPTIANIAAYVTGGGRLFYTGYDSTFVDDPHLALLGATGSYDFPDAPGPIASVANAMTTGLFDLRGVTPTGGNGDRDALTGLIAGTVSISADTDPFGSGGHEWTLHTVGAGLVAFVANGSFTGTHASWTTTTGSMGARAYNAVLRNFAYNAGGFSGACTGEGTACTGASGRTGVCHTDRCCTGCWDGSRCFGGTSGGACGVNGGACISCSDAMACTLDVCTAGACSNPTAPAGTLCEDGMFCTVGETCNAAGTCGGGSPNGCDDGSACTVDTCDATSSMCVHTPGGGCFIAGVCTMAFTVNMANPCQVCDPARSTTAWSPRTVGIACGSGSCTGAPGSATLTPPGTCDAAGMCTPATAPMPCPSGRCAPGFPSTTCDPACTATSCPAGLACSTTTMRCVTPAAIGETCAAGSECTSGFCADGVCCMTSCDGLCDSCDLAGSEGTCMPSPEGRACGLPICVSGSVTAPGACTAAGMCMRMAATRCPSGLCLDATTCNPDCNATSCAIGQICTAGRRCVTPAAEGEACGADDECVSGSCADGVCCDEACDDFCVACNQAGRVGRCTPYTAGTDPDLECPVGSVCGGGRGCVAGTLDGGVTDAGMSADAGGGGFDAGPGIDAGPPEPPARRGCSCRAAGLPSSGAAGTSGLAALVMLAIAIGRRRR